MSQEQWVVIDEEAGAFQAELIPVVLSQEGVAHWAYNLTVGPLSRVQILVPAGSEAFARQVLEDYRAGVFEEEDDENESNMGELTD
jgi:hypothetical protein